MSLNGLEQAGEIGKVDCNADEIKGLLDKAERKLKDASAENISTESRLEHAYTVILTCTMIALRAMNYRVLNKAAHHYIAIETSRYTLGLDEIKVDNFQSLRSLRHQDIYGLEMVISKDDLVEAIEEAGSLLSVTRNWLIKNHPDLI